MQLIRNLLDPENMGLGTNVSILYYYFGVLMSMFIGCTFFCFFCISCPTTNVLNICFYFILFVLGN